MEMRKIINLILCIFISVTLSIFFFFLLKFTLSVFEAQQDFRVGFYSNTCPTVEAVVHRVVENAVTNDQTNAAALLRLQFHDCFVQGCDGSILLKNEDDESGAPGNAGVSGFSIIGNAKAELEHVCPGVVSCADIVALAARDAVFLARGPFYQVPSGRRDGLVSTAKNAANLPDSQDSLETLRSKFSEQGLSDRDLVLLSAGAHTIGKAACFFVAPRLDAGDPAISPDFFSILRASCPQVGDDDVKIPLDWDGESQFDTHIFNNIRTGRAVIASDAVLYRDEATKKIIDAYLTNASSFAVDFAGAITKMGRLNVKSGNQGEIRRLCNVAN